VRLLERWAEGRGEEVREEEREYAASFCSWRKREDIVRYQCEIVEKISARCRERILVVVVVLLTDLDVEGRKRTD
jgi:hypothetical protein